MGENSWSIPWELDVGLHTQVGPVRKKNEDSARVSREEGIFAVADGMGGHRAGEVASALAIDVLFEVVSSARSDGGGVDGETMRRAVDEANRRILGDTRQHPEHEGMGTTLTALLLTGDEYRIGHVGDSRAWRVRDGEAEQLTTDHTVVEEMVREGRISLEESRFHPMRHVLSRCLGIASEVRADVYEGAVEPEDTFVLATDGLVPVFDDSGIAETIVASADAEAACRELVRRGCEEYGKDNVTAAVVRCLPAD